LGGSGNCAGAGLYGNGTSGALSALAGGSGGAAGGYVLIAGGGFGGGSCGGGGYSGGGGQDGSGSYGGGGGSYCILGLPNCATRYNPQNNNGYVNIQAA
jgi:loricrin